MNIRQKFALIMITVFMLNLGTLIGFYNYFLSSKVESQINEFQHDVEQRLDVIMTELEKNQNEEIFDFSSMLPDTLYLMTIKDEEGTLLYINDVDTTGALGIHASRLFQQEGHTYLIELTALLPVNNTSNISPVVTVVNFQQVMIMVMTLVLTVGIYLVIVKPIESLEKDMDNYCRGIKPKKTKRGDEFGKLQNRFSEFVDELEEQNNQQSRIIASISHDIKTPLTSILGYAERLERGNLSQERQVRYVETIYEKSLVIKELIDEFDDYLNDRLETSLKLKKMSVSEIVEILKCDYQSELHDLGVVFTIVSLEDDKQVEVDISKLRRVFGNIIGNSLKHLSIENIKKITISISSFHEKVVFMITDNGDGVQEEDLERIFEPLYTCDQSRKVAGLGLAICRSIISAHGGKIYAKNQEKGGLKIIIELNEAVS